MRCVTRWITITHTDDPCDTGGGGGSGNSNPPSGGDNGVTSGSPPDDEEPDKSIIGIGPNDGLDSINNLETDPLCEDVGKRFNEEEFKNRIEQLDDKLDET
ncbi:hypothetical protein JCM19275_2687 [Nonlabens ulvanivorans]|uniref:Uncharacterized protein n=3 Tax=Nonlabens ulvanivorans TaxID=906888 RepID=A0A090W9Z4_NONUL|nr:hypothetical protein [Nonlabens ulvanivorans]GAK98541.1 hypothetical protein JCM19314_2572 [Nonlabens ulvanivorans]GAL73840.1 hypothetical protein JCM19275_2687 [Nonlabens ulvanivorans]